MATLQNGGLSAWQTGINLDHESAVCRLIVSAKPLNITYNPTAIRQVLNYFSIRKSEFHSSDVESRLACQL